MIKQDLDYYFPIKTKTACQSKWSWSTIWLDSGETSSCHRVDSLPIPIDDFGSFHNLPEKIVHREKMLKGQWPGEGCEYCKDIEDAGGFSDRMHNNDLPGYAPTELKDDPTLTHVKPTIVEIFAKNTCNFACSYCSPGLSSRIEQEMGSHDIHPLHHAGWTKRNKDDKELINRRFEDFFKWLEENIQSLSRLQLLGGETFIQHDLMNRTIELLKRKPNPGLQLSIISNFNPPQKHFINYVDKIKYLWKQGNIDRFDLTASIDCWGPQAEYVRNGLNREEFEKNFAYIAEQSDDFIRLNVNQTVSSFTMKTMPDLIKMLNKYNKHKHIGHYAMLVDGFPFMRPEMFKYETWEKTWDNIFLEMKNETLEQKVSIDMMSGLQRITKIAKKHNSNAIKKLYEYHDELDRRRNTHWRDLWPELVIQDIDDKK